MIEQVTNLKKEGRKCVCESNKKRKGEGKKKQPKIIVWNVDNVV